MTKHVAIVAVILAVARVSSAAQGTVESTNSALASVSDTVITLATVEAGHAVGVYVNKQSTSNRTFTVTDTDGDTFSTVVTVGNCATERCGLLYMDYSVVGNASVSITVDQSSTFVTYGVVVFEINCPAACAADVSSSKINGSGTSHPAAATAADIDTAANVVVVSACVYSGSAGGTTPPSGYEDITDGQVASSTVYEDDSATAFADEQGTHTSVNSVTSWCLIASVKDSGGGGGGSPGSLSLLGVGR